MRLRGCGYREDLVVGERREPEELSGGVVVLDEGELQEFWEVLVVYLARKRSAHQDSVYGRSKGRCTHRVREVIYLSGERLLHLLCSAV